MIKRTARRLERVEFSEANQKLRKLADVEALRQWTRGKVSSIYSFDLLAGHSCPFAKDCRSRAVETETGRKVVDGRFTQFRCYAASQEARLSNVYNKRKRNWDTLRDLCRDRSISAKYVAMVLADSMPFAGLIRIHSSGDFFSFKYFEAWVIIARQNPAMRFYCYTKAIRFVERYESEVGSLPDNLKITASRGGKDDHLITPETPEAVVVYSEAEAEAKGLEIDHDDSHAATGGQKFALLIHGTQPAGSDAQRAIVALKGGK